MLVTACCFRRLRPKCFCNGRFFKETHGCIHGMVDIPSNLWMSISLIIEFCPILLTVFNIRWYCLPIVTSMFTLVVTETNIVSLNCYMRAPISFYTGNRKRTSQLVQFNYKRIQLPTRKRIFCVTKPNDDFLKLKNRLISCF